jgi:peroxiredoxin
MKYFIRFLSALSLLIIPFALLAQTANYTINGKVGHLATATAYLRYNNEAGEKIDSTVVINGVFKFTGDLGKPSHAYLIITKKGTDHHSNHAGLMEFYLESGNISINSPDSIENAIITGSPINDDNAKLKIALAPVNAKKKALNKEYKAASVERRNSKDFSVNINKRSNALDQEQKAVYLAFIKQNPNSQMSLFALKDYEGAIPDVTEIEPIFNSLSADVKGSKMGMVYAAAIEKMKKTAIGAMAPDFTQADTLGNPISLHDFKGKYVLVDFWASWCGPCRAENPNVVKAYAKYKDKGFNVLGISLDQTGAKDKWLKAIHDDHLTWTQVSDLQSWKNEVAQLYSVQAIPQNFLVGPDGKIVGKNLRGDDLNNKLKELFDK